MSESMVTEFVDKIGLLVRVVDMDARNPVIFVEVGSILVQSLTVEIFLA